MLLWPAAVALLSVWNVFRDPAIDYRLVVVGALLPDLLDGPFGGAGVAHTLVFGVTLLMGVMVGTRGRRLLRRRLLALPIGALLHLVADGVWTRAEILWWPGFGWSFDGPLPGLDHGLVVLVAQEVLGAVALVWFWTRFGLGEAGARGIFVHTGRLPRDRVEPGGSPPPAPSC